MTLDKASPVEWVWFTASIVATCFCAWGLRDTIIDVAFQIGADLPPEQKAPRLTAAEAGQRAETFRLLKCVTMDLASGASLFLSPPPPPYNVLPQSLVSLIAWIIVAIIMIMHSVSDRFARKRMVRYSTQARPIDPSTGVRTEAPMSDEERKE